jgi:carboxyl-terminal processing protease
MSSFGNMPPLRTELRAGWAITDSSRVGVIGFNAWMPPINAAFKAALDTLVQADGIIIDLRGNPGGVGQIAQGVAGYFVQESRSLGEFRGRTSSFQLAANPRKAGANGAKRVYAGPVAVLVDGASGSTSEVFTAGMRDIGRVRVFGTPTAGAALPARITELPNGDGLLHAIFDFIRPSGVSVEGNPIRPDEIVLLRRRDLLAGRDAGLEAAMHWIAHERASLREVVLD